MAGFIDLRHQLSTPQSALEVGAVDTRAIVWLDIDNTLYDKKHKIHDMMASRIRDYFISLGLEPEKAKALHQRYYKEYGLAIRGLVKHHDIDALDYDRVCDASLPLETILAPSAKHRALLQALDPAKVRVFGLTNAYKTHARRVLSIIGVEDLVEGLVFCDYARQDGDFSCKPELGFYEEAISHAGGAPSAHYFVDDSLLNIRASVQLSPAWHAVHYKEKNDWDADDGRIDVVKPTEGGQAWATVSDLEELREVWRELFVQ